MNPVPFEELKHFPHMLIWWFERSYPPTHLELLPPSGVVMEDESGKPLCAGFLYVSNGRCAQIAHLVADPKLEVGVRSEALDRLILLLTESARSQGFREVSGATTLPGLVKRYERLGFRIYENNVTLLGREV